MELPFLKKKNRMNQGGSTGGSEITRTPDEAGDEALTKHIVEELMTAISKKDIKTLRDALQAIVMTIRSKDAADQE